MMRDRDLLIVSCLVALMGTVVLSVALLLQPLGWGELWAIPALVAISWALVHFPYKLGPQRQTTVEELGLCLALFLFPLAAVVPGIVAGYFASALIKGIAAWRVAFNSGIRAVSAGAAVLVVRLLDFQAMALPGQIATALLAAGVYLLVADAAVCWLLCRRTGAKFWPKLRRILVSALGPWFVASSFGVLIAIASYATPWVFPVGAISGGFVIYDSIRRYRDREDGRRLEALHLAGQALNGAVGVGEVQEIVAKTVRELLDVDGAELRQCPPGKLERGYQLSHQGIWLVVPERNHLPLNEADIESLATLVSITESVLRRIGLVAELERQSLEDHLTKAGNRRHFEQVVGDLTEAGRGGCSLVLFDVDLFKEINDVSGHEAGDRTLVRLATVIRKTFRPEDLLFRLGGDEFVLLLPDMTARQAAAHMRTLQRALSRGPLEDDAPPLKISVGIIECSGNSRAEALLGAADRALYQAKRAGGDTIVIAERRNEEDNWPGVPAL
jgi:diguanylate cyclase (GGDEF)-like protein